jgi:hypothetical protein
MGEPMGEEKPMGAIGAEWVAVVVSLSSSSTIFLLAEFSNFLWAAAKVPSPLSISDNIDSWLLAAVPVDSIERRKRTPPRSGGRLKTPVLTA